MGYGGRNHKYPPEKEAEIAKQVENLGSIHCKWSEIAAVLDENADYLRKRYSEDYAKGQERGRISLRRWMYESAKKGNVAMQIWLSKQELGMTDRVEHKHELALIEEIRSLRMLSKEQLIEMANKALSRQLDKQNEIIVEPNQIEQIEPSKDERE